MSIKKDMGIKSTIGEIQKFIEGKGGIKYLVNVETSRDSKYAECIIHDPHTLEKRIDKVEYEPFLYIKDFKSKGYKLYGGDQQKLKTKMLLYGITIKKMKTGNQPRLEDGFCYKVTSNISFEAIEKFFSDGHMGIYDKMYNDNGRVMKDQNDRPLYKYKDLYYTISTNDQFFISTGNRLFKGMEEYSMVHKAVYDIETTGLRYQHARIFAIGVRDNRGFERVIEVNEDDNDEEEIRIIKEFFEAIDEIKPAVISGYNSEDFDYPFILERAEILGFDITTIKTTLKKGQNIKRRPNSSVKIGNSSHRYTSTMSWGYSINDIMFAAKKTEAINSDIKNTRLKYICQFENITKPNRMYIDGENIGKFWKEDMVFVINPENNNYKQMPDEFQESGVRFYKIQKNKENLGDEKYDHFKKSIFKLEKNPQGLIEFFKEQQKNLSTYKFITGKEILRRYLLDDLWETEQVDELYNSASFAMAKLVPTTYSRVTTMGNASVWNLLMTAWSYENDLAIPDNDVSLNFGGGLTRCYKKGYTKRVIKIDYASLYPMIQLTYDIFPMFDVTGVIKKMLTYLTTTRNIYKKLARNKSLNDEEIDLLLTTGQEDTYNKIKAGIDFTPKEMNLFDVKQLPIKIINNSLFGALGAGVAFNWSDNRCAWRITCYGRLYLRRAVSYFKPYDCEPLLAVTDGVNFSVPNKTTIKIDETGVYYDQPEGLIEDMWKYGGQLGINALIEKFNREEMTSQYMSVDNDGEFDSCLNLSRINYALMSDKVDKKTNKPVMEMVDGVEVPVKKIKLTGNTIKSKIKAIYIDNFNEIGLDMILKGKGEEFIEHYYKTVEDIFYQRVPLSKIATKKRYKMSIKEYINRGTDKNGRKKAKMAHMELIIQDRINKAKICYGELYPEGELTDPMEIYDKVETYLDPEPDLDSYIYFINVGDVQSRGDSAMMVEKKVIINEETKEEEVVEYERLASELISKEDFEDNANATGKYNVAKYIAAFNMSVKSAMLDGFIPEVRERLLIKLKKDRKTKQYTFEREYFDEDQMYLQSFDLDNFEDSMALETKEVLFYNRYGYKPETVWSGVRKDAVWSPTAKQWDTELRLYEEIYENALQHVRDTINPNIKSIDDQLNAGDYVLIKDDKIYDLGYNTGDFIQIKERNIKIPKLEIELQLEEIERSENDDSDKEVSSVNILGDEEIKNVSDVGNLFIEFLNKFGMPPNTDYDELMKLEEAKNAFDNFIEDNSNT